MSRLRGGVLAAIAFACMLTLSPIATSQSSAGYASYLITAVAPTGPHSVLVNETVRGTDKAGFSDLILQIQGGTQNLTYSRLVNASKSFFPYLPTVPSQAIDYSNGTYSVHANFTTAGSKSISFQGNNYTLSVYSITVLAAYGNKSFNAQGTIEAFPSSLVYSASLVSGVFLLTAVLQGTNLQLTAPSSQMATAAVVSAGLGVGGIAAAAALIVRRRERKPKSQEQKPMHWVD